MSGMVMTNAGPKTSRKQSGRLGTLQGEGGEGKELRSSTSFTLPPLNPQAYGSITEHNNDSVIPAGQQEYDHSPSGVSPARRSRKAALMGDLTGKSIIKATLDVSQLEHEMSLVRENHRLQSRGLMELWVNSALEPGHLDLTSRTDPMKMDPSTMRGLATYGLTRIELRGAGLSDGSVDRLFRGLYVYTIGFFDMMQDILQYSEFRVEVLGNVWKAYLKIAESALKVAFKSEYLQLFQAQQLTAAELLVAKEALAEVKQDSHQTEKALAWLTAAHAEERAMRIATRQQLQDTQDQLDLERRAHQAAVQKYVDEVEVRGQLQVELDDHARKLVESALCHADLIQQRDEMIVQVRQTEAQCGAIVDMTRDVTRALVMDDELGALLTNPDRELVLTGEGMDSTVAKAKALKTLSEALYAKWIAQASEITDLSETFYRTKDQLRSTSDQLLSTREALEREEARASNLEASLQSTSADRDQLHDQLESTSALLDKTDREKRDAEESNRQLAATIASLEAVLASVTGERDSLRQDKAGLEQALGERTSTVAQLSDELSATGWRLSEISKGMAVAMRSLATNQAARQALQRKLADERARTKVLSKEREEARRISRVLQGKLDEQQLDMDSLRHRLDAMTFESKKNSNAAMEMAAVIDQHKVTDLKQKEKISGLQAEVGRLTDDLSTKTTLLHNTEENLKLEKNEVMRLFESLQGVETQIKTAAAERKELSKLMEKQQADMHLEQERAKRREDLLNLDINRLQSEVKLERTRIEGLELQIETQRKALDEATDQLERKREKKKRWKGLQQEAQANCDHYIQQLEEKNSAIALLEERLVHVDVDVAILVADRGRKPPHYGDMRTNDDDAPQDDGNYGRVATPPTPAMPEDIKTDSDRQQERAAEQPAPGPDAQGEAQSQEDIYHLYRQWDAMNQRTIAMQAELDQVSGELDAARRAYEGARAVFYTNPSEPELRKRLEAREQDVREVRLRRREHERKMSLLSDYCRALQAKLRHHEHQVARKRLREVEWRTGTRDLSLRSELSSRVDDAHDRALELQEVLNKQKVAYDMLQAARSNLEGEMLQQEEEIAALAVRLQEVTTEKLECEAQIRHFNSVIADQGASIAQLQAITKKQEFELGASQDKLSELLEQVQKAERKGENQLRRQIETFAEEKALLVASAAEDKAAMRQQLAEASTQLSEMQASRDDLAARLGALVERHVHEVETCDPPRFMGYFQLKDATAPALRAALEALPQLRAQSHLLAPDEAVVDFIVPTFETTLVVISQLYADKMVRDLKEEEFLLGGLVGTRASLHTVMYDFFVRRFGSRPVSEVHLAAFLRGVLKYRQQHPKIRMFARLAGMDDSMGVLPPTSVEFYVSLLNRVYARAGPLVSEAVEGYSFVKCRVLAKAVREMLRSPFSHLNEDAGNITEALKHLALNDEEKPIDLEIAMEMAFKAWVKQYRLDHEALLELFDSLLPKHVRNLSGGPRDSQSLVEPSDFLHFLKKIDSAKAKALSEQQVQVMYRAALRAGGPSPVTACGPHFVSAVLDHGFTGLAHHLTQKLETIKAWPPYDEVRLMVESWKSVRPVVEAQVVVLEEHRSTLRGLDTKHYVEEFQKLELLLEEGKHVDKGWAQLRRVLQFYVTYKNCADGFESFAVSSTRMGDKAASAVLEAVFAKTSVRKDALAANDGAASSAAPSGASSPDSRSRSQSPTRGAAAAAAAGSTAGDASTDAPGLAEEDSGLLGGNSPLKPSPLRPGVGSRSRVAALSARAKRKVIGGGEGEDQDGASGPPSPSLKS